MASDTTPKLAPEIFGIVIRSLDSDSDMVDLWTRFRLVSKTFKREVELFFRDKYLPKTCISFDIDVVRPEHVPQHPTFYFSSLSEDQRLAVFAYDFDGDPGLEELVKSDLRLYVDNMKNEEYIIAPKHSVETSAYLNDTPIPMLSVKHDDESLKLSCDWRSMFSSLFYEESAAKDALGKFISSLSPLMEELSPAAFFSRALQIYTDLLKESVKRTRRERIDKQLEKIGYPKDIGWDVKGEVGEGGVLWCAVVCCGLGVGTGGEKAWKGEDGKGRRRSNRKRFSRERGEVYWALALEPLMRISDIRCEATNSCPNPRLFKSGV